jgi:hypothetical protein
MKIIDSLFWMSLAQALLAHWMSPLPQRCATWRHPDCADIRAGD